MKQFWWIYLCPMFLLVSSGWRSGKEAQCHYSADCDLAGNKKWEREENIRDVLYSLI